jgi:LIVCS family branched-chain amino acid:cation transporter
MSKKGLIVSTGLAMFSMFFGSGNLVFPLLVGQSSEGHYFSAFSGIFLTGVLVPFLGIFALFLFKGDSNAFFGRLGKGATFWFPLIALSLMGPFGVLARCIAVAHGAFRLLFPEVQLWLFSLAFCALIFLLTFRKTRIVPLLGSVLTPVLIASLVAIAYFGLRGVELPHANEMGTWASFSNGIFQGYQTMDLLAAFFFSAFVLKHLDGEKDQALPVFLKASFIGAGLLAATYFALVLLGSAYATELAQTPPQEMLGTIAQSVLGVYAAPVICIAIILACLTTAIVLASLFSDFLRKAVSRERLPSLYSLGITLAIAFSVSTLAFSGIMKILGPVLEYSYPALIVFTLVSIVQKTRRGEVKAV